MQQFAPGTSLGRAVQSLALLASDPVRALSLAEQSLISGANFAALLLLARAFDATEFGSFSFAYLCLLFVVNLHRSAVVVPFVIHTATHDALAAEAAPWRRLNLLTALLFSAALAAGGLLLPLMDAPAWMPRAFLTAALLVAPSFYYEFRRRWLIQLDRYGTTVVAAGIYAMLWLSGIGLALAFHSMAMVLAAFVGANTAAALFCIAMAPPTPCSAAGAPPFGAFLSRLAHFIGWSVMSNLAYNGYAHLPPLILGALAGPVPVAVFQAMRNFAQPLATLTTAIDNFDKPRAARAMAKDGTLGLRRALLRTTAALATLSAPYLILLAVMGDRLIRTFYGSRYDGHSHVLWWFVGAHLAVVVAYPLETSLFLIRRPDLLFRSRLVAALAGIALSVTLVPTWGITGAMAALIGGLAVSGVAAAVQLALLHPPSR
jgi:O-antigen/teichoic acid export membrane protein